MRRSASSTTYPQRQTRRPRLAGGILLLLSLALLWPAVLSFDPTDWPSPKLWPHPQPVHNVCGRLGAWLAYQLFFWLGQGTYPLVLLATLLAILALARGVLADWPLRLTGLVLTSVAFGAASRMIQPGSAGSLPEGNGGIVGIALASVLGRQFAPVGSALLLACAGAVGLLLAADEIVVGVGRWAGRAVARAIRPARAAVVPAGARQPSIEQSAAVRINTGGSRLTAAGAGADGSGGPQPGVAEGAAERSEQPSSVGLAEEKAGAEGRRPASAVQAPVVSAAVAGGWPAGCGGRAQPWPRILDDYELPPLGLLDEPEYPHVAKQESLVREKARLLERTLRDFRVEARVVQIDTGPVVTMYELEVAPGIKVSQIHSLADDMARVLKAPAVRVVAPMPGKNTIGVEVPSLDKEKVRLRELLVLAGKAAQRMVLPLFIGKDVGGNPLVADLAAMPHLLIAGTTGSGKSVCINALVMSLLMTQRPDHVKLILVDPKMVELSVFRDVPHLMGPIVTDMAQAEMILDWAATKMDERYELLAEAGVKNVSAYNRLEP
ncbi:MAG: DNA translocase FtsK 4TM domain-containing protein, partial [Phycisphaerae bacterium]